MKKWLASVALGAAMAAMPSLAMAQDEADPNTGALSISGGVDFWSAYYFRGYLQEDQGLIAQPWATVGVSLVDSDDFTLSGYVGIWNSVHSEQTLSDGQNDLWYESDIYAGLSAGFGPFTLGAIYTIYTYPGGAFDIIKEVGVTFAYDDTGLGLPIQFKPYVGAYFETKDSNGTQDSYLEVGIAPGISEVGGSPISLTFPIKAGMSIEDYYLDSDGDDTFFGYTQVGVVASLPLPLPAKYGSWSLNAGVHWLHLCADSVQSANDDDEDEILGSVGVSFSY